MKPWRPLTWLLLSVACFVGAVYFWRLGSRQQEPPFTFARPSASAAKQIAVETVKSAGTAPLAILGSAKATNAPAGAKAGRDSWLKYRLSNTTKTVNELARSDKAILLQNALIDTSHPWNFPIPDSLRAKGDPGTYIVQARGPIDDAFRAALKAAGADIVSYIPNNAYLVRASAAA